MEFVIVIMEDLLNIVVLLDVNDILEVMDLRLLELAVLEAVDVFDIILLNVFVGLELTTVVLL